MGRNEPPHFQEPSTDTQRATQYSWRGHLRRRVLLAVLLQLTAGQEALVLAGDLGKLLNLSESLAPLLESNGVDRPTSEPL